MMLHLVHTDKRSWSPSLQQSYVEASLFKAASDKQHETKRVLSDVIAILTSL